MRFFQKVIPSVARYFLLCSRQHLTGRPFDLRLGEPPPSLSGRPLPPCQGDPSLLVREPPLLVISSVARNLSPWQGSDQKGDPSLLSGGQISETAGKREGCDPSLRPGRQGREPPRAPTPLSFGFAFLCLGNDLFGDEWWGFLVMGKPALKVASSAGNPV